MSRPARLYAVLTVVILGLMVPTFFTHGWVKHAIACTDIALCITSVFLVRHEERRERQETS